MTTALDLAGGSGGAAGESAPYGPDLIAYPFAASGLVLGGQTLLGGFSITETTGAAGATVDLFDGESAGGILIARIALLAGESTRDALPYPGLHCRGGLFANVVAGAITATAFAAAL